MGEQQQETVAPKSGAPSTILAVIVVIAVAAIVAWLGWGSEIKSAWAPASPPAAPPQAAKPVVPEGPRPTISAVVSPRPLGASGSGALNFGGVYCFVIHYDGNWHGVDQQYGFTADAGYPRMDGTDLTVKGKWALGGGTFDWNQTIRQVNPQTLSYDVSLKSEAGVQTNALALGINMPISMYADQQIIIDGTPLKLPADPPVSSAAATLMPDRTVKTLEIATPVGRIALDGPVSVTVQDNRAYGGDVYYIRIGFTPSSGLITDANLKFTVRQVVSMRLDDAPETTSTPAKSDTRP